MITLPQVVSALKANRLNEPDCDCMLHYCNCEHMGFVEALRIV